MGVLKDFDCKTVKKSQVVEGKHKWALINSGLSYCGFCKNNRCEAFNHNVVCNRGHGDHLVNDDLMTGAVRCPACNTQFQLEYVALFNCKATATLHTQQEEVTEYEAKGDEIVKLGTRAGNAPVFEGALLSIKTVKEKECIIS